MLVGNGRLHATIMKLKPEFILKRVAIWLLISAFFMLIGEIFWDATPAQTALTAAGLGLVAFMRFGLLNERGTTLIEEFKSEDGLVIATIEARTDQVGEVYLAKVTRNYQTGVFAKEKSFDQLQDAQTWLTTTYQLELEKHAQHPHKQQND
ncbi:MAG: hypothetical protein R3D55_04045 [Chloroflexota bacterium]